MSNCWYFCLNYFLESIYRTQTVACHSKLDLWARNWRDILAESTQTPPDEVTGGHVGSLPICKMQSLIKTGVSHLQYLNSVHADGLFLQVKDDQRPHTEQILVRGRLCVLCSHSAQMSTVTEQSLNSSDCHIHFYTYKQTSRDVQTLCTQEYKYNNL